MHLSVFFRVFCLIVLTLIFGGITSLSLSASFRDVSQNHPNYIAIETLSNNKIIQGYEGGSFKPEQDVNRVEALKIILESVGYNEVNSSNSSFSDVLPDAWYFQYVEAGVSKKIINGDGETGLFVPDRTVKKAEFIKMLLEAFDISVPKTGVGSLANDITEGQWYVPYMRYAKTKGIIMTDVHNNLSPEKELTRGECAEILFRLIVLEQGEELSKLLSLTESTLLSSLNDINNNNLSSAIIKAEGAVLYSRLALEEAPTENIVQAAHELSLATKDLLWALESSQGNVQQKYAEDAKKKSLQSVEYDISAKTIADTLIEKADEILK